MKKVKAGRMFIVSYLLMAFIPMIVCIFFFYPEAKEEILENSRTSLTGEVENSMDELDRQIEVIKNIPIVLFSNEKINRWNIGHEPGKRLQVSEEIKKTIISNSLIKEVFLYSRDNPYLYSAYHGNIPMDRLKEYRGDIGFLYESWNWNEMLSVLDTLHHDMERPAEPVILNGKLQQNIITFTSSIPRNNRFAYATTLTMIDGRQLAKLISKENLSDGIAIYNAANRLIYQNNMDEELLKKFADKNFSEQIELPQMFGDDILFFCVRSKTSGWMVVQTMDMSAYLQKIEQLGKNVTFIMLGLSVTLGLLGYGLMLLNLRPLENIVTLLRQPEKDKKLWLRNTYYEDIERGIRTLKEKNFTMTDTLLRAHLRLKKNYFRELLSGNFSKDQKGTLEELRKAGFVTDAEEYRIFILRTEHIAESKANQMKDSFHYYYPSENGIEAVLLQINGKGKADWDESAEIGVGNAVYSILDITESYSQAYIALDYAVMTSRKGKETYYSELPDSLFHFHSYPLEIMSSLAFAVKMNKLEDVERIIKQIKYMIQIKELPPYYLRSLFYNTISIFMEEQKSDNKNVLGSELFSSQLSGIQMADILERFARNYIMSVEDRKEDIWLTQVKLFIDEHYSESTLSLTEAAEYAGMSPAWFSTLFKEKSGKNFKEYVDQIRLEKAKELLKTTDLKIEYIAELTGYNSSSYSFTRFFKKYMGISPSEYRKSDN